MHHIKINLHNRLSKIQQIVQAIAAQIEIGKLLKDDQLPSINEFNEQYAVARDTVEKAYKELRAQGYITSVASKGYFVVGKRDRRIKVLLIFNKLSSYKKIVYDSILETLGEQARVDLQIHHYDPRLLKEIIENNMGAYQYYVVMPHFFQEAAPEECLSVLKLIPEQELILLDKYIEGLESAPRAVYQEFEMDIYHALNDAQYLLDKYERLVLVFPKYCHHPTGIIEGLVRFCLEQQKRYSIIHNVVEDILKTGTSYIVLTESDLALLIKKIRKSDYQLGKDIGIISFNETVFKELLDITVITTDFKEMGRSAAQMILNGEVKQIKNPFKLISRNSL